MKQNSTVLIGMAIFLGACSSVQAPQRSVASAEGELVCLPTATMPNDATYEQSSAYCVENAEVLDDLHVKVTAELDQFFSQYGSLAEVRPPQFVIAATPASAATAGVRAWKRMSEEVFKACSASFSSTNTEVVAQRAVQLGLDCGMGMNIWMGTMLDMHEKRLNICYRSLKSLNDELQKTSLPALAPVKQIVAGWQADYLARNRRVRVRGGGYAQPQDKHCEDTAAEGEEGGSIVPLLIGSCKWQWREDELQKMHDVAYRAKHRASRLR